MKLNKISNIAMVAIILGAVTLSGCGGSRRASTPQQKAAVNRGVKLDKEECEEKALEAPGKRASGSGLSQSERLAKNTAALDARANLVTVLQTMVAGMIKNFDQEHQAGANTNRQSDFVNQSGQEQKGLIDSAISSNIICSNTYVQEDGSFRVYVCVELAESSVGALYKKLSNDKKISIQFEEKKFREEMEKELENYRNSQ